MHNIAFALAVAALPTQVRAQAPVFVSATNPESASGFKDLADCEQTVGGTKKPFIEAKTGKNDIRRGSLFNRAAGNFSRCEIIDGEFLVVVYPGRSENKRPAL